MADKNDHEEKKATAYRGSLLLQKLRELSQPKAIGSTIRENLQETSTTRKMPNLDVQEISKVTTFGRGRADLLQIPKDRKGQPKPLVEEFSVLDIGRTPSLGLNTNIVPSTQPIIKEHKPEPFFITRKERNTRSQSMVAKQPELFAEDNAGVLSSMSKLSCYETFPSKATSSYQESQKISRQGTTGKEVEILSNYIDLKLQSGKGLFQYEVKFSPDIDSIVLRRKLLNQHAASFGHTKSFDGILLYLPQKLSKEITVYKSDHPSDGSVVTLTVIFKKQQKMSENIQFFNVLLARIMRALNLVRIGRQHFNPTCARAVPQHRLEVWPGYVTAINEYEGGLKLCIDAKYRVMRMETIRDLITEIYKTKPQNYKDYVAMEVIGASVLTRYNNKTYRIDDIAWDKNPMFIFLRKGIPTRIIDYYKQHWNLRIKDTEQPLLVHRAKEKSPTGETQEKLTLLVPELCFITGLTDNIRSDFRIMKDLDVITKVTPNGRRDIIKKFIQEIQENEVTRNILSAWGLKFDNELTLVKARVLPPEKIMFGNRQIETRSNADWTSEMINSYVLRPLRLSRWYIFYCQQDTKYTTGFIKMLLDISKNLGLTINTPREVSLRNDRIDSYLCELRNVINNGIEMVVIVFPSNRTDRYSAIKKLCCVEKPIPSQVIISRTLSRPDKLRSITQKIVLQMNCKLGGALWAVNIPFDKCMVCGIDVYHPGIGQGRQRSVAGFVASMDKLLTSWYSKICLQGPNQELIDLLQICFIASINAYKKHNGSYPNRIIVYRDGVGDGQIDTVRNYEVKQLLSTIAHIDPDYKPHFSVIVVQKRINTRLFLRRQTDLINPEPGTVIDSSVTRANFYDFFLVPQNIRHGTVTPTHYIVVYDGSNMKTDHMQRFTYKLCHLYYNWPGTIRVPAPCQYAHKLVSLVGQNIQMEPDPSLCNYLFYL